MSVIEDRLVAGLHDAAERIVAVRDIAAVIDTTEVRLRSTPQSSAAWPARRRLMTVVGTTAVVALGILAAVQVSREQTGAAPTRARTPLYVLPRAGSGYTVVSDGYVLTTEAASLRGTAMDATTTSAMVVGNRDPEGFTNLMIITLGGAEPRPTAGGAPNGEDAWVRVEGPTGPVQVSRYDQTPVVVAQKRDGRWLTIRTRPAFEASAIELLDHIVVNERAELRLESSSGVTVVEDVTLPKADVPSVGTSIEVSGPSVDTSVTIETANADQPLPSAVNADRARRVTINGVDGWLFSRNDTDGEWQALVWSPAPGALVAVSGEASLDVLEAVAGVLEVVDEAAWNTALPSAERVSPRP